jgi:hypothetical protein
MIRPGHGVIEAATGADVIKLFPATACSMWQDALYVCFGQETRRECTPCLETRGATRDWRLEMVSQDLRPSSCVPRIILALSHNVMPPTAGRKSLHDI